jgi:hypothetical protein
MLHKNVLKKKNELYCFYIVKNNSIGDKEIFTNQHKLVLNIKSVYYINHFELQSV